MVYISINISLFFIFLFCNKVGEIIDSSCRSRHLSTIPLKNFHLFKIAESVINFYFKKKILTNNFKHMEVFQ